MDWSGLIEKAMEGMERAYAPYSGFRVGAALLGKSGEVYTGCNVESCAYTPTCCAERTALVKAVSEGERAFSALAVVSVAAWMRITHLRAGFAGRCCLSSAKKICR